MSTIKKEVTGHQIFNEINGDSIFPIWFDLFDVN